MKKILSALFLLLTFSVFAQNEQLAANYFEKGDFEKALVSYEELLAKQPGNSIYFQRTVESYQQLSQFEKAGKLIQQRLEKYKQASLFIELGYNYQLQKDEKNAVINYEKALDEINTNPSNVYAIAMNFEKKSLLDYALKSYTLALTLEPKFSFNQQIAVLYGQQGKVDLMIEKLLEEGEKNPQSTLFIQNYLSRFMMEEGDEAFVETLRKALILKAQKNQDIYWNQFLSWFYVQQKEYGKAFIQEKAIYKRNPDTFSNIVNLAEMAIEENQDEAAVSIINFVLENTQDLDLQIFSNAFLLRNRIEKATPKEYAVIKTDVELALKKFGVSPFTISLQELQAEFFAFQLEDPEAGKAVLKNALNFELDDYQKAELKMQLADILLLQEQFNQALIYYSQIEEDLKNDEIGHQASLKVAKTSYFQGDFQWAQSQFKVLKSASTQLIANDAIEYFLLINDNTVADSAQVALKKFARGDYLRYQNKNDLALTQFSKILSEHKGDEIQGVTLLRMGKINEKLGNYTEALRLYKEIIDLHSDGIYVDEALFFSAELYQEQFKQPELAKPLYEKMIFDHQDSIHFIEARRKFREIRGDTNS
ncbi:tetratricopeptide repeat protein [Flavobacterium sp.]|jgi:tetratricopeptide (TPR) repeat protein|uniref:tetratricopeptide repeat protein n=1 Tax=Flavobacterium sp. TaxID=239 RepID=UPI0037BFB3D7